MKSCHIDYVVVLWMACIFSLVKTNPLTRNDDWLAALPFTRELDVQIPPLEGKDIVILQNLLRRHAKVTRIKATGLFDEKTKQAVKKFQESENLQQQNGILDPNTGRKIIELLMHDGYKDDGTCPLDYKFNVHVPLYRNRSIETMATLYKCDSKPVVLHKFIIRARGGTKNGQPLNQLTSNGDTPTGLSTIDLNTKFPDNGKLRQMFGPYPILRIVKGVLGNVAIGKDDMEPKDTFLNNYRFGILVHTGIWKNWNSTLPMGNSLGCLRTHPYDQKKIFMSLKEIGVVMRQNTFGKLPYLHRPQGFISVEEID